MLCTARVFTVLEPHLNLPGEAVDVAIEGSSLDQAADAVLDKARDEPGPVGVLAMSLGAIVAMAAVSKQPGAFAALALMSTSARAPRHDQQISWSALAQRVDGEFHQLAEEQADRLFAPGASRDLLNIGVQMAREIGPANLRRQLAVQRSRRDLLAELAHVEAPVLVVAGSRDQLCPLVRHQEIAGALPHAGLAVLDGLGHLMTLEDPKRTATVINTVVPTDALPNYPDRTRHRQLTSTQEEPT